MFNSFFLAKLFGLYLIVRGVMVLLKRRELQRTIDDFIKDSPLRWITGEMVLIVGLLLVLSHNVWEWSWRLVITVLSWIVLLKAVAFLLLPQGKFDKMFRSVSKKKNWYVIGGVICVVLGLYLVFKGAGIF